MAPPACHFRLKQVSLLHATPPPSPGLVTQSRNITNQNESMHRAGARAGQVPHLYRTMHPTRRRRRVWLRAPVHAQGAPVAGSAHTAVHTPARPALSPSPKHVSPVDQGTPVSLGSCSSTTVVLFRGRGCQRPPLNAGLASGLGPLQPVAAYSLPWLHYRISWEGMRDEKKKQVFFHSSRYQSTKIPRNPGESSTQAPRGPSNTDEKQAPLVSECL